MGVIGRLGGFDVRPQEVHAARAIVGEHVLRAVALVLVAPDDAVAAVLPFARLALGELDFRKPVARHFLRRFRVGAGFDAGL
jgi:hypothetical protein